jgi:putative phage-type endonuclease
MKPVKLPLVGPDQRTPEWYAIRQQTDPPVFGASAAAALCGLSEYRAARDVYEDRVHPQPTVETEQMLVGRFMEPGILGLYGAKAGCEIAVNLPMYLHPDNPNLAASLDGYRRDNRRPVEAKYSTSPRVAEQLGEEGSDWVPTDWLMQVQQQLDVTGQMYADIAVFLFGRLRIHPIERNDDLIHQIHKAAEEMRQRIENRDPPEVDYQHSGALNTLRRAYPHVVENAIVLDGTASDAACRYLQLGKEIKELEKERAIEQAKVLDAMGEASHAKVQHLDKEFRRIQIAGGKQISYISKPYVRLTHGRPT